MLKKTRFKSLNEFYSAVDNLIERLKSVRDIEEANKLDSLMHQTAWTTSSELLGELMLALKGMKGITFHTLPGKLANVSSLPKSSKNLET